MNLPSNLKLAEVLHGSGDGFTARALAADGQAVCVKTFSSQDGFFEEGASLERKRKRFEEEKTREKAAAASAPVAFLAGRLERVGDTPFWVRPYAPRSLRDWVAFKEIPDARRLAEVCRGIIAGLVGLERLDGGTHGNLTLGNVLLLGKNGTGGVRLVDVRTRAAAETGADKRALGLIIYQLVRGEFVELDDRLTTVPEDEDWSALGRSAEGWREFCSQLLSPYSSLSGKSWSEIEALVRDLEKTGGSSRKRTLALVSGLAVVLGAGVLAFFLLTGQDREKIVVDEQLIEQQWQDVLDDLFGWGRRFFESRRDFDDRSPDRRAFAARYQDTREPFQKAVDLVIRLSGAGALFSSDPALAEERARAVDVLGLRDRDQEEIVSAYLFFADLRKRILEWDVHQALRESRDAFRADGFAFGEAELGRILRAVDFEAGALTYESLFALQAAAAGVSGLQSAHERYRSALADLRGITQARFPALHADFLQARLAEPVGEPVAYLRSLTESAQAVLAPWRAHAAEIVEAPFARAEAAFLDELPPEPEAAVRRWRTLVDDHRRVDPALLGGARARLAEAGRKVAELEVRVNELLEPGDPRADFVERHRVLRDQFEAAVDMEPIQANRSRLSEAVTSLTTALDRLAAFATERLEELSPDIEAALAAMRGATLPFEGPLAESWQAYLRAEVAPLREDSFASIRDFLEFRRRHDRARANFLRFQDEGISPLGEIPPPRREGLPDGFLATTDSFWQARLTSEKEGLARAGSSALFVPEFPAARAADLLAGARTRLAEAQRELGAYLSAVASGFTALASWEEPPGGFPGLWENLRSEGERRTWSEDRRLRPLLEPLREASAVAAERSAGALADHAFAGDTSPFLRFLAFRSLAESPAGTDVVERFARADRSWEEGIPEVRRPEWRRIRQSLWKGAYRAAASARARLGVAEAHGFFAITAADLAGPERVSFEVFLAMREVRDNAAVYQNQPRLLGEVVNTLATAPGGEQNPRMQSLLSQLREIRLEEDAVSGVPPFVERGWRIEEETEERMVLRWRDHRLAFHRVEGGRRDAFIAETECSIGLFNDWMNESGGWEAAGNNLPTDWADFLRNRYNPMDDYRLGFRLWRPARNGLARGGLELTRAWFEVDTTVQDEYRELEASLVPPEGITPDLPMNQMAARTARFFAESMGMRLPRPAEWETAARSVSGEDGHFWSEQWTARVSPGLRGEITLGSFYRENRIPAAGARASNGPLLRPVGNGAGRFRHLAGNVAEIVFDPEGGTYFVGGGSSLAEVARSWRELHPLPARDERRIFSDVGLRLAFDAPLGAPHLRFLALLEETWSDLS